MAIPPMDLNPNGACHGGLVAAIIDQAMGVVGTTVLPAGSVPVTAALNVEYFAPATPPLQIRASVSRHGSSVLFVAVDVDSATGVTCARARHHDPAPIRLISRCF